MRRPAPNHWACAHYEVPLVPYQLRLLGHEGRFVGCFVCAQSFELVSSSIGRQTIPWRKSQSQRLCLAGLRGLDWVARVRISLQSSGLSIVTPVRNAKTLHCHRITMEVSPAFFLLLLCFSPTFVRVRGSICILSLQATAPGSTPSALRV